MNPWMIACLVSWVLWVLSVLQVAGLSHQLGARQGYQLGRAHEKAGVPWHAVRLQKEEGTDGKHLA